MLYWICSHSQMHYTLTTLGAHQLCGPLLQVAYNPTALHRKHTCMAVILHSCCTIHKLFGCTRQILCLHRLVGGWTRRSSTHTHKNAMQKRRRWNEWRRMRWKMLCLNGLSLSGWRDDGLSTQLPFAVRSKTRAHKTDTQNTSARDDSAGGCLGWMAPSAACVMYVCVCVAAQHRDVFERVHKNANGKQFARCRCVRPSSRQMSAHSGVLIYPNIHDILIHRIAAMDDTQLADFGFCSKWAFLFSVGPIFPDCVCNYFCNQFWSSHRNSIHCHFHSMNI